MGCVSSGAGAVERKVEILKATPFVYRLSEEELARFAQFFRLKRFKKGQTISDARSEPEFYVVGQGEVQVCFDGEPLTNKEPGDFFGLIAAMEASLLERKETLYRIQQEHYDLAEDLEASKPKNLGKAPLTKRESEVETVRLATTVALTNVTCLVMNADELNQYLKTCNPQQAGEVTTTMGATMTKNLRALELFQDVPQRKIHILSNMLHYVPLRAGERLFEEGSTGQQMYIVYQGTCNAVAMQKSESGEDEEEVVLNTFSPGSFFGEVGLILDMPRTAAIQAVEPCLLLELRKDDFRTFLKLAPNLHFHTLMKRRFANHFKKYKVPFFAAIPDGKYPLLASLCKVEQIEPDTVLFKEGDEGNVFYIIAHGEVAVTVHKRESLANHPNRPKAGSIIELSRMGPGKYFGEVSLLKSIKRTATVRTITRCVILSITKANFEKFFESCPEALADFEVKLGRYDVALRSVIYHPAGLTYFTRFLEKEFSEENIHFWVDARAFRHIGRPKTGLLMAKSDSAPEDVRQLFNMQNVYEKGDTAAHDMDDIEMTPEIQQDLIAEARRIYDKYIEEGSPEQVNMPGDQRRVIWEAIESGEVGHHLYSGAEKEILALMERDSFARFKQSEIFRQFLERAESYDEESQRAEIANAALTLPEPKLRSGSFIEVDEREIERRATLNEQRSREYGERIAKAKRSSNSVGSDIVIEEVAGGYGDDNGNDDDDNDDDGNDQGHDSGTKHETIQINVT